MTALAPVATAVFAIGSLAMSAKQAKAQKAAAAMQAEAYNEQAAEATLKGRYEALEYKQRGVDVLRRLNEVMAANIARAAAGGVDPTSGSAALINTVSEAEAVREKNIATSNAIMAEGDAGFQAYQYRVAGNIARKTGDVQAAATIGNGLIRFGQLV
jgi:hypothetical protein